MNDPDVVNFLALLLARQRAGGNRSAVDPELERWLEEVATTDGHRDPTHRSRALALAREPAVHPGFLVDLFERFDSDEIAEAVARNPATNHRLLGILHVFLPEAVAENPTYGEITKDSAWGTNQRYYQRVRGRASSGELAVATEDPQPYRVRYYLEHGNAADFRHLAAIEAIPNELFRPHLRSRNSHLRKALAERPFLAQEDFAVLARDKARSVRQSLAANPGTPPDLLRALAADPDEAVRTAASANPNCPPDVAHAVRMAQTAERRVEKPITALSADEVAALLRDPATPTDRLDAIAVGAEPPLRYGCGIHPNASPALLAALVDDPEPWLREAVAFNPATPSDLLEQLAVEATKGLERALAANVNTPKAIQLQLAERGSDLVRYTLANRSEDREVLERLCRPARGQRTLAAWQEHLALVLDPKTRSAKLAGLQRAHASRHGFVGRHIARHPNCPKALYGQYGYYCYGELARNPTFALQLLENPDAIPREPAKAWLLSQWYAEGTIPGHIADFLLGSDDPVEVRRGAGSASASIHLLQPLAFHGDPRVRNELAGREDLTRFLFEALAADPNKKTRELVAANPACPPEVLARLAEDRVGAVKAAALANKRYRPAAGSAKAKVEKAPAALRDRGPKKDRIKAAREARRADVLADLAQDREADVREAVASNDRAPPEVLVALLADREATVRFEAIRSELPADRLEALLADDDERVRRRALQALTYRLRKDKGATQALLARAARDPASAVRAFVAEHVESQEIQRALADDSQPEVLRGLARNDRLDRELGRRLLASDDRHVRRDVVHHSKDVEAVYAALDDGHHEVRVAAAFNKLALKHALRFARHGDPIARAVLAQSAKTIDDELFDILVADDHRQVQEALAEVTTDPARIQRILAVGVFDAVWKLAHADRLTADDYARLAGHGDEELRHVAASMGKLTDAVFAQLLADPSSMVRQGLTENRGLSREQRRQAKATL